MKVKKEKKKKKLISNDEMLIKLTTIFLFPLFIVGLILKSYDSLKITIIDFIKYKILKRKKEDKIKEWWIS